MKGLRLTVASWQMLQRLDQPSAALVFCSEDGRFHFTLHEQRLDLVRPSTIDTLNKNGLLVRDRDGSRTAYLINDKGKAALQQLLKTHEFVDVDVPVNQNIKVVTKEIGQ